MVTEDQILAAMKQVRATRGWTIEGAAGVAVAAYLQEAERYRGKRAVVVICGGNLSAKAVQRLG
jgi:threonine dehydratase